MVPRNEETASSGLLTLQKRARHAKVKTGCITCRIRRVKCDETKPKCMRCLKYGAECGGYPPSRSKKSFNSDDFPRQYRVLIPKLQCAERYLVRPATNPFESDIEMQYFAVFSNQIATAMFPYFETESWSKIIHQACAAHPSIRHAAIAIGALGKTYEIARLCKKVETGERVVMDVKRVSGSEIRLQSTSSDALDKQAHAHHRHALEQYDKAITIMRNDNESNNHDLRTSLIICMIINCFEHIHGNHKSAAIQAQAGLALIHEFQSRLQSNLRHPQGYSSPNPDKIEDFLVQSFGRLEIQSMSVFDPRPQEVHIKLKDEGKEIIAAIPNPIETIEQARNYLDLITRRIMHFNGSIQVPRVTPSAHGTMPYPSPVLNMLPQSGNRNHNPIPWIELKIPLAEAQRITSSEALNQEKNELVAELEAWIQASNDLLQSSMRSSIQGAISALTLCIAALMTKITILSCLFLNETAYDTLFPEFFQIVQYASILVALQNEQKSAPRNSQTPRFSKIDMSFSFDVALIPALYIVMVKCRHGPTRHKALSLLRENPRREGVWDSAASSGLGAWVISLEEEAARQISPNNSSPSSSFFSSRSDHIDVSSSISLNLRSRESSLQSDSLLNNYSYQTNNCSNIVFEIPEEKRVRGAQMRFDLLARKAFLECTQLDLNTGKFARKKDIFLW